MKIRRSIELEFDTRCGDVTAAAIVASVVGVIEGRLTEERVTRACRQLRRPRHPARRRTGVGMKVWTTRSGAVLHASSNCSELGGKHVLSLEVEDALTDARRCDQSVCFVAFRRAEARAA